MSILENIGAGIVSIALFIGGLLGYTPEQAYAPDESLGADTVAYFGGQTFTLAGTGISSSGSSFTLTSFTITQNGKKIQDSDMADTFYGTFEPGSRARQEFFSCTTVVQNSDNTATISGCTRGLSPVPPYTASTTLQFAHGGGSSVIFSNTPQFYEQFTAKGNDETISGDWTVPTPSGNQSIANKAYVLSVITGTSSIQTDNVSVAGNAGETFATGTVVFFQENDQEWYRLDVDFDSHYIDREIGIANGPGTNGLTIPGGITLRGMVNTAGLTAGANYFASSVAGGTTTATTSQPLGVARSTTQLYFNPSLIKSTVYTPTTFSATTTFSGWVDGIASTTVRYYTTTGASTWTKPANLKYITVETVGAGGGGDDDATGGGSGGAGATCRNHLSAAELSSTTTVAIRVGTGGLYNSGTPTAGGSSDFGQFCSAGGGSPAATQTGGAGGTATLGDLLISGGRGGNGDASEAIRGIPGASSLGGGGAYGSGGNCSVDPGAGNCAGYNGIVMVTEHF